MTTILVTFATKAATTQSIAERIGARLTEQGHEVAVVSVQDDPDPAAYGAVVVGSGILAGSVYSPAKAWVTKHAQALAARPYAAFIVCLSISSDKPEEHTAAEKYPEQLTGPVGAEPVASEVFAGSLVLSRRTWWERALARIVKAPTGDFRDWTAVDDWAGKVAGLV